ncbi:MAG: HAMP domain-containing protein, partial [Actinobacteria bacterium]|nr:HAMP domain-containing protein [Actinomycetota bacterium]
MPGSTSSHARDPGIVNGRGHTSLLPKVMAAFLAVLLLASVVTLVLETRLTRQALRAQAHLMTVEQGNALDFEVQRDSLRTTTLLSTLTQQVLTDAASPDDFERGLFDVLSAVGKSDSNVEVGAVLDLQTGEVRQRLPSRTTLSPLTDAQRDVIGPADVRGQRVVPLQDGGYGLVYSLPVRRLGDQLVVAVGYALDEIRARDIALLAGVSRVEVVVAGEVVATSDGTGVGGPVLGDPLLQRETQQVEDGRLVRYVAIGADRVWGEQAAIALISSDPLAALDARLTRTRVLMVTLLIALGSALSFLLARVMTRPIRVLTETATTIAGGDLEQAFELDRRDEIGTLAGALERMRQALRAQLLVIRQQAEALQEAARRIVGVQDAERRRVAQDLHDGIQQRLVVLRMQVGAAREQLRRQHGDVDEVADGLADAIDDILAELRATGQALFPSILGDRGLDGALHSLAARSDGPVDVTLHPDPLPRCDEAVETNAYFLISEAVANALKHAEAERIRVEVRHEGDMLRIRVIDDGVGFDPSAPRRAGGVVHLRDR